MMPCQKATLDLEAWSSFQPKERSNDYEYNLLLYKFKSFFNEVRDYHKLHSNCSVTQASSSHEPEFNNSNKTSLPAQRHDSNNHNNNNNKGVDGGNNTTTSPQNYTSRVFSDLKKRFEQQASNSPSLPLEHSNSPSNLRNNLQQQTNQFRSPKQGYATSTGNGINALQHYSSSHNISSIATNNHVNLVGTDRPEVRQRSNVANSRFLMSKSSERLDSINNNHLAMSPALVRNGIDTQIGISINNKSSSQAAKDPRYPPNDSNIYDAVSPDDNYDNEHTNSFNSTTSSQNLSRSSNKIRLESFKSSPGLGTSFESKVKMIPTPIQLSSTKSTSNTTNNDSDNRNNSFSSSNVLESSNNNSSSLSLLPGHPTLKQIESQQYANYVNIDFFLKRSYSPSFDGLDEDSSNESEEHTTNMSHSLSSDQLCDEALRDLSPRELARKLSTHSHNDSSTSLTPASSGDILDDARSPIGSSFASSSYRHLDANASRVSSLYRVNSSEAEEYLNQSNLSNPRDINSSKSVNSKSKTLGPIHENQTEKEDQQLNETRSSMRSFLSDLNLSSFDNLFDDKAQRRIVKESFAVEYCGRRKLRHLFLFNDVIVCAKYQASSKQKFTFDVKWYLSLDEIYVSDVNDAKNQVKFDKESIENQILAIRTNLMLLRGQMQHIKRNKSSKVVKIVKKLKKKRTELEADLVLLLPHLPLIIKHLQGKKYTFFFSSNFDRSQWIESIRFLQSQLPNSKSNVTSPSSSELQAWIQTCRKNLNPSLGTFLLRSNCDDDLLYGDLNVNLTSLKGLPKPGQYYFCFEVDSYGHFSQKASSVVLNVTDTEYQMNEEYVFPLDGAHSLRILLYEDLGVNYKPSIIGKAHIELSRALFLDKQVEKIIPFNANCNLTASLSHINSELMSMRISHTKLCPTFGLDLTQVCKKEKTNIPLLIQLCVNEVERRGMREVGIYRMSGTSTDVQRLKKAFETNPFVAELLLRDIDINSVTGFLKTYLREIPEGLFINKLYLKFVAAFNIPQSDSYERTKTMIDLFHKIPTANQQTISYLVEHLVRVNKYESYNKMSLTNLATVLGPNILKPPSNSSGPSNSDPFTAVVIGSMSQAGILYFFLNRKFSNLPLTELDPSETKRSPPKSNN